MTDLDDVLEKVVKGSMLVFGALGGVSGYYLAQRNGGDQVVGEHVLNEFIGVLAGVIVGKKIIGPVLGGFIIAPIAEYFSKKSDHVNDDSFEQVHIENRYHTIAGNLEETLGKLPDKVEWRATDNPKIYSIFWRNQEYIVDENSHEVKLRSTPDLNAASDKQRKKFEEIAKKYGLELTADSLSYTLIEGKEEEIKRALHGIEYASRIIRYLKKRKL